MRNIVLTGGLGFIGSHLVDARDLGRQAAGLSPGRIEPDGIAALDARTRPVLPPALGGDPARHSTPGTRITSFI